MSDDRAAPARIEPGQAVEVRITFSGAWRDGFVVSHRDDVGYWLLRGDGSALPAPVDDARVRPSQPER